MTNPTEQIAQLKTTIEALEAQRSILGDMVVEASIKGLCQQISELKGEPPNLHQTEEERRQATILFSDLSGYTAMSEKGSVAIFSQWNKLRSSV